MTTRVIVEANHGWPVRIEQINPITGAEVFAPQIVQAGEKRDFFVHSTLDIRVHEIQPDEETAGTTPKPFDFGQALHALKQGKRVARAGWNGKGMFVYLVAGSTFKVNRPPLLGIYEEGTEINYRPHIDIKNVDGSVSTWSPSIGDALADDWQIVEEV